MYLYVSNLSAVLNKVVSNFPLLREAVNRNFAFCLSIFWNFFRMGLLPRALYHFRLLKHTEKSHSRQIVWFTASVGKWECQDGSQDFFSFFVKFDLKDKQLLIVLTTRENESPPHPHPSPVTIFVTLQFAHSWSLPIFLTIVTLVFLWIVSMLWDA